MGNALARIITQRGKTIFGGLVSFASGAAVVGGIFLSGLSPTGTEKKNDPIPAFVPAVIHVTATGSTSATQRYDAFCLSLADLIKQDVGSGTVVRLTYHNVKNPVGASMDIGFVDGCNQKTESGSSLIENSTASGGRAFYTTGTAPWQGSGSGKYLKGTISKDPTAGFEAYVSIWVEDIIGE